MASAHILMIGASMYFHCLLNGPQPLTAGWKKEVDLPSYFRINLSV